MSDENKKSNILNQFGISEELQERAKNRIKDALTDARKEGGELLKQFNITSRVKEEESVEPTPSLQDYVAEYKYDGHTNSRLTEVSLNQPIREWDNTVVNWNHDNGRIAMAYDPWRSEPKNKIREVKIKPMNNGFMVEVGCQSFVFESYMSMFNMLEIYYKDPEGTEKLFNEGKLFDK